MTGEGIEYFCHNYDPTVDISMLTAPNLPDVEKVRIANKLLRLGAVEISDLIHLGFKVLENGGKSDE